jgi:hypothetical protein
MFANPMFAMLVRTHVTRHLNFVRFFEHPRGGNRFDCSEDRRHGADAQRTGESALLRWSVHRRIDSSKLDRIIRNRFSESRSIFLERCEAVLQASKVALEMIRNEFRLQSIRWSKFVLAVALTYITARASLSEREPQLSAGVSCEQTRALVAEHRRDKALAWAVHNGLCWDQGSQRIPALNGRRQENASLPARLDR